MISTRPNLTKEQRLIASIKQGDFYNVLDLVSQGIALNFHDENLDTVFSIAAHYGQIKILEYLATNMKKTCCLYHRWFAT